MIKQYGNKDWFGMAFSFTIGAEGGYTNNPNDPGGETKYGISHNSYPNEDIKNLTIERAKEIYYKNYWLPSYCQELVDLGFPLIAINLFDCGINCGCRTSKRLLQKSLGIEADGLIGKKTIEVIKLYKDLELVEKYLDERLKYYDLIISKNSKLKEFKNGWRNRIALLKKYVLGLNKEYSI